MVPTTGHRKKNPNVIIFFSNSTWWHLWNHVLKKRQYILVFWKMNYHLLTKIRMRVHVFQANIDFFIVSWKDGLSFSERWNCIGVCQQNLTNFHNVLTRYSICIHPSSQLWDSIFQKRTIQWHYFFVGRSMHWSYMDIFLVWFENKLENRGLFSCRKVRDVF